MFALWGPCLVFSIVLNAHPAFGQDELSVEDDGWTNCGQTFNRQRHTNIGNYQSPLGSSPWHITINYFRKNGTTSKWVYKCSGTMLTPSTVVTAASCVFNENVKKLYWPEKVMIIAAKKDLTSKFEVDAQSRTVNSIYVRDTYQGQVTSQEHNIALISVKPPFILSDFVQPACIDWYGQLSQSTLSNAANHTIQGSFWGSDDAQSLQEGVFSYQNLSDCRNQIPKKDINQSFLNYDKYCISTPAGKTNVDTGAGLVISVQNKYVLRGIVSTRINEQYSAVTNVSEHYDWVRTTVQRAQDDLLCKNMFRCQNQACILQIHVCNGFNDCGDNSDEVESLCADKTTQTGDQNYPLEFHGGVDENRYESEGSGEDGSGNEDSEEDECGSSDEEDENDEDGSGDEHSSKLSCVLPTQLSGVRYELEDKGCTDDCILGGGDEIEAEESVKMYCGRGTGPPSDGPPSYACIRGKWFPSVPQCIKLCSPLIKPNVEVSCEYRNDLVNCAEYMRPGTITKYHCKQYYRLANPILYSGKTTCRNGGKWTEALPDCEPECGVPNKAVSQATPTITGGIAVVSAFEFPWQVGIYQKNATATKWDQFCGGSLISTHLILTAAHCLFLPSTTKVRLTENVLVAGGKYKRDYYDEEPYQQYSIAKKLIIPESYNGFQTGYAQDIAFIDMESTFSLNDYVRPICISFTDVEEIPKAPATVAGWGFTETKLTGHTGVSSSILLKVNIPLVSGVECRRIVESHKKNQYIYSFRSFITYDKFCGLYVNGSGPQPGDSGGGINIKQDAQWFIIGIASTKDYTNTVGAFTSIFWHQTFIKDTIRANDRSKS